MEGWGILVHVALYIASGAGVVLSAVFLAIKKDALLKTTLILIALVAIVLTSVIILNYTVDLNQY